MSICVCPGTFDPVTVGHLDIFRRSREIFDEVVVAVAINANKRPLLSVAQRVELAQTAVHNAGLTDVRVVAAPGLLVDFCRDLGARHVVKGLRGGADLDAEVAMALMNRNLTGLETIFLLGEPKLSHIASSLVKDVARHGGDISTMVDGEVAAAVYRALEAEAS